MITITVAGNAGKDAVAKTTQGGDSYCRFSLPGTSGFGEREQTVWFDVTKWGKGADGLARHILKGTPVTVTGELSTREHEGKTYLQIRADRVKLQGTRAGQQNDRDWQKDYGHTEPRGGGGGSPAYQDDIEDDVPFVTANPARESRLG